MGYLGKTIQEKRDVLRITQEELARRIREEAEKDQQAVKISNSTISQIETGKVNVAGYLLKYFAKALNIDLAILMLALEADSKIKLYKTEWEHCHPASHTGKVWIQIHPQERYSEHYYQISWGPWNCEGVLKFTGQPNLTLWHMKGSDGLSIPIFLKISPPCYILFGKGEPPEPNLDINRDWK